MRAQRLKHSKYVTSNECTAYLKCFLPLQQITLMWTHAHVNTCTCEHMSFDPLIVIVSILSLIGQEPLSGAVECPSGSYGKFKCVYTYSSHTLFLLLSVLGQVSTYTLTTSLSSIGCIDPITLYWLEIVIIILCSWPISKESKVVGCLISFTYM